MKPHRGTISENKKKTEPTFNLLMYCCQTVSLAACKKLIYIAQGLLSTGVFVEIAEKGKLRQ